MHGIIAGLWSSLSGAGRFVSRLASGILVDHIGFDNTAGIVTSLQVITVKSDAKKLHYSAWARKFKKLQAKKLVK